MFYRLRQTFSILLIDVAKQPYLIIFQILSFFHSYPSPHFITNLAINVGAIIPNHLIFHSIDAGLQSVVV